MNADPLWIVGREQLASGPSLSLTTLVCWGVWCWIRRVNSRLDRHDEKFKKIEEKTGIALTSED